MGCFGTGLRVLFHFYEGLFITRELFEKIEKTAQKLLLLACGEGFPYWRRARNSNSSTFFLDFLKDFMCDEQKFVEVQQHPDVGPETTHTMCEKFRSFWKNQFFFIISYGGPTPP